MGAAGVSSDATDVEVDWKAEPFVLRLKPDAEGMAVTGGGGTGGMEAKLDWSGLPDRAIGGIGVDTDEIKERVDEALDGRRVRPGLSEDGGSCSLVDDGVPGRLRIGGVDALSGTSVAV